MAKEGSTVGGLMDCFGTAVSMSLQYGVPLEVYVNKFSHTRFEPMGHTKNPDIRIAKSIVDYIFRWLGITFLPGYREATLGYAADESVTPPTDDTDDAITAAAPKAAAAPAKSDAVKLPAVKSSAVKSSAAKPSAGRRAEQDGGQADSSENERQAESRETGRRQSLRPGQATRGCQRSPVGRSRRGDAGGPQRRPRIA